MNNSFGRQFAVAFRIWLLAVLFKSILGTFAIWNFGPDTSMILWLMIYGSIFGLAYSLPVFIIIMVALQIFVRNNWMGNRISLEIYVVGILFTFLSYLLFESLFHWEQFKFFLIAELAGLLAITLQYRSLKKLGSDFSPSYDFDYEN